MFFLVQNLTSPSFWSSDDELHNLNISENSKTAEALAQKKKGKPVYTGYDDDEFAEGGAKKGVLNKYDEEIEGREETGFRLGGAPVPSKAGKGKGREEDLIEKERVKLNLDYTSKLQVSSRYQAITDIDCGCRELHHRLPPGG